MEKLICFGDTTQKVGVFTPPQHESENKGFCTIFLNAGLIHKIGPNRIYVKSARALAKRGISAFRFDFSGLGDSETCEESKNLTDLQVSEIKEAMDAIQINEGISRFVLIGICSGAEIAFETAIRGESRIIGLSLIDGIYADRLELGTIYNQALGKTRARYYKKNMFNLQRWSKVLRGKSGLFTFKNFFTLFGIIPMMIWKMIKPKSKKNQKSEGSIQHWDIDSWQKIIDQNIKMQLIFSEGDTAMDLFELTFADALEPFENGEFLTIERAKDVDHTFTPIWSQQYLAKLIGDWAIKSFESQQVRQLEEA